MKPKHRAKPGRSSDIDRQGRTAADRRRVVAELLMRGFEDLTRANDPEPELQEIRERYRSQFVDAFANRLNSTAQRRAAATAPRSSRQSPIRRKILDIMTGARAAHTFEQFLNRWLERPYDELAVVEDGTRYFIEDTHAGGEAAYTRAALRNLWTQAGR